MSDVQTVRGWVAEAFRSSEMRGRDAKWRLAGVGIQWVVEIDSLPYGRRLGVEIGLDLQDAAPRKKATECPILLHLPNLPSVRELPVMKAFDLGSDLDEGRREQIVRSAAGALCDFVVSHQTIEEVREAYREGAFDSAAIHWATRETLEQSGKP